MIKKLLGRLLCFLGEHDYEKHIFMKLDDGYEIKERICKRCKNCPTWDR